MEAMTTTIAVCIVLLFGGIRHPSADRQLSGISSYDNLLLFVAVFWRRRNRH